MVNADLRNISKIPIEKIISLSNEDISALIRELDKNIKESQGLKNWIIGVINLKNSINGQSNCNDIHNCKNNNRNILGGVNEQITDY